METHRERERERVGEREKKLVGEERGREIDERGRHI